MQLLGQICKNKEKTARNTRRFCRGEYDQLTEIRAC